MAAHSAAWKMCGKSLVNGSVDELPYGDPLYFWPSLTSFDWRETAIHTSHKVSKVSITVTNSQATHRTKALHQHLIPTCPTLIRPHQHQLGLPPKISAPSHRIATYRYSLLLSLFSCSTTSPIFLAQSSVGPASSPEVAALPWMFRSFVSCNQRCIGVSPPAEVDDKLLWVLRFDDVRSVARSLPPSPPMALICWAGISLGV